MLPPVRCLTCGAPLGHLWEEFQRRVRAGEDPEKVLDDLGVYRYCCRRTLYTSVVYIEQVARYSTVRVARYGAYARGGEEL
ncbi:MAG: DNA-directed RNA polymerase subunit N [Acidilobus sp.]